MGLELGPPWLVVVVEERGTFEVVYRDNFTGAGFERVRRVVMDERGSSSAVLGRNGSLARHPDGRFFDPVIEMKGRNSGTPAEKGHRAYLLGCELLRETPYPLASQETTKGWGIGILKWWAIGLVLLIIIASV